MSVQVDMELMRPGLIATAACAVVWWFLVQPAHEHLSVVQADLAEQRTMIQQLNQASSAGGPSVSDELALWSRRAQDLSRYVRGRTDAASIYEQFTVLALEHGVLIKRINPRQKRRMSASGRAKNNSQVHVIEFGYKIDLEGGFEQVARFIDAVATQSPLCMVTTITLTPVVRGQMHLVNATIETSHCRLERPLSLADAQEQDQ